MLYFYVLSSQMFAGTVFIFQTIYRNVLDDVYEYPILEKDLKEFQKILGMHRRQ